MDLSSETRLAMEHLEVLKDAVCGTVDVDNVSIDACQIGGVKDTCTCYAFSFKGKCEHVGEVEYEKIELEEEDARDNLCEHKYPTWQHCHYCEEESKKNELKQFK